MTAATRTARRPGWVATLVAPVVAVAAAVFGAGPASAATISSVQTPAGASTSAGQVAVWLSASITAGQRLGNSRPRAQIVVATGVAAETGGGGLVAESRGRLSAARLAGSDVGGIRLGGMEFSEDEIAQLTYQHVGAGDIPGRPSLAEISTALSKGESVGIEGQNALKYEYGGVRIIVNGDAPSRSTAYYRGSSA